MSAINDGGPAFPRPLVGSDSAGTVDFGAEGMSLRDWFAGQALAGLMASGPHECAPEALAHDAYLYAGAMLEAREKAPPTNPENDEREGRQG